MKTESANLPGRRLLGALVGAGISFGYSLVSATINLVFIRDVPMYIDVGSVGANVIWTTLGGAILGYIINWPFSGLAGVTLGAFLGSTLIFVTTFLGSFDRSGALPFGIIMAFYGFFPLTVIMFPFTIFLRWGAGSLRKAAEEARLRNSLRTILILIAVPVFVGSFSLLSGEQQRLLRNMNAYIQTAQGVGTAKIPLPFQPVVGIIQSADRNYALEWTDKLDRFPIPVVMEDAYASARMEIVFAYFDSGESIACLFRVNDAAPQACLPATRNPNE
jgi:hypothetical protein